MSSVENRDIQSDTSNKASFAFLKALLDANEKAGAKFHSLPAFKGVEFGKWLAVDSSEYKMRKFSPEQIDSHVVIVYGSKVGHLRSNFTLEHQDCKSHETELSNIHDNYIILKNDDFIETTCLMPRADTVSVETISLDETLEDPILRFKDIYEIHSAFELNEYLQKNPQIIDPLIRISEKINEYFAESLQSVMIDYFVDPDEDFTGICIEIETELPIDRELDLMDKFDFEWWLNQDVEIRKIVSVSV